MRLWHLIVAVAVASVLLSIAREPTARIFLIVFLTALGEFAFGGRSASAAMGRGDSMYARACAVSWRHYPLGVTAGSARAEIRAGSASVI